MAGSRADAGPAATFRTVLDVAGVPIYTLDAEGRFSYVNDAVTATFGYHQRALLGADASLLFSDSDVRRCREAIRDLLETGGTARRMTVTVETADERRLRAELSISLLPLEGGFQGTVGVLRDVREEGPE